MIKQEKKWYKVYREYWNELFKNSDVLKTLYHELDRDFNNMSLNFIDDFLQKNYKEISCAELSAIYVKFFLDLKNIKSNSGNFVGFSEFLVLRALLHLLNKEYYPKDKIECYPKPNNENIGFFSFGNNDLIVTTESIAKKFCNSKKRPDIILYRNDWKNLQLFGVISIKACVVSKTYVENEVKFLQELNEENKKNGEVNGLIVVFAKAKERENLIPLWNNKRKISEVLKTELKLDSLKFHKKLC